MNKRKKKKHLKKLMEREDKKFFNACDKAMGQDLYNGASVTLNVCSQFTREIFQEVCRTIDANEGLFAPHKEYLPK